MTSVASGSIEPQTVRPSSVVPVCNSSDPLPDLTHNLSRKIPVRSHSNFSCADIFLASNVRIPSTSIGQFQNHGPGDRLHITLVYSVPVCKSMNEFINIYPFWSSPYVTAPSSIPRAVPTSYSIASLSTPASSVPNHPPPHHHVSSSSFVSPSSNASIVETNLSLSKYNAGILGLSRVFQDMARGYYVKV